MHHPMCPAETHGLDCSCALIDIICKYERNAIVRTIGHEAPIERPLDEEVLESDIWLAQRIAYDIRLEDCKIAKRGSGWKLTRY